MVKPAHHLMAYNTQIVVDSQYKLIISTEVSSNCNDYGKLCDMATTTNEALDINPVYIGDTGYYSHQEMAKCEEKKILVYVPIPNKQNKAKKKNHFIQDDFIYDKVADHFTCPNNAILSKTTSFNVKSNQSKNYRYRASSRSCKSCGIRDKCIPKNTSYKQLAISEYYDVVQKHRKKMQTDKAKEYVKKRSSLVEHPFGTIKQNLGWSHYLVRGLEKVKGENSLIMLAYNFKRLLNIFGVIPFKDLLIEIQ
jgi:hypothetical protein